MTGSDRTCLVTGASRGIGRAIATELAEDGAAVVVNYFSSEDAAHDVVEEIESDGGEAYPVQADVSDRESVERMREGIHDRVGPVDVVVNNAGINRDRLFAEMTHEDWEAVIGVCLTGTFNCTKAFYDDVREADHGRVVTVSSVVGKQGNVGQANYAAAKSGIFGFTRTLALELASSGATANCVAPGFTRTSMVEGIPEDVQDRIRSEVPLERFADPEEVASVVRFLASEEAGYITGEVLDVNGGVDL